MRGRVAYFGVFTALALIFSYVETLIPFHFGIPGMKLGLANIIIVLVLYRLGGRKHTCCPWCGCCSPVFCSAIISASYTASQAVS